MQKSKRNEDSYDEEEDNSKKTKKRGHKKVTAASRFIEDQAESDDSELDQGDRKDQYYKPEELVKKTNKDFSLKLLEDKYRGRAEREMRKEDGESVGSEDEEDYDEEVSEDQDEDDIARQGLLPGINDPQMWQVRVKKNQERTAVIALLNKSLYYQSIGKPLKILSVTSSDTTEGYIYVEAFKDIHVKQACEGLHFILNKYILVPTEEMPVVF